MDIRFDCPCCGQSLAVETKGAGMIVNCPSCKEDIEIPLGSAPPSRPPSPPASQTQSLNVASSYVDKYLMPGENVVYSTQLHWAVFLPLIFWSVITGILFFIGIIGNHALIIGALLMGFFGGIPLAITSLIAMVTSEFVVTNKRVLIKTGWIRRYSLETLLTKIESIRVEQSVLGRVLDYGTIVISGTGGSKEPFHKIADPMLFRRRVQDQISATEQLRNA
jgi:Bacterial PH domain